MNLSLLGICFGMGLGLAAMGCQSNVPSEEPLPYSGPIPPMAPKVAGDLEILSWHHDQVPTLVSESEGVVIHEEQLLSTFDVLERTSGEVFITNMNGDLMKMLHRGRFRAGKQQFTFTHEPLPLGEFMYYVCYPKQLDTIVSVHFRKHN